MSVLGLNSGYTVRYNPLPSGVPSGFALGNSFRQLGLYLTVYPLSRPNTDTVWNQGYQVLSGEDKNHSSRLILSNHDFFGQINSKIHCSLGLHHVQVVTKKLLSKSMKASCKIDIFRFFMVQFYWYPVFVVIFLSKIYFMTILCVHFWLCLLFSYAILQAIYDICIYFTG